LPDDLTGGTFTITNLGMYGVDAFTPVINLPELAILGAGRIQAKPAILDGDVVVRQMWTLSLVFDHRLVDGAPAARFLQCITQLVENPYLLIS
jgi:pyruvate dehydrogenase E2 component (dihydrolipoamide acetyltransferase)